MISTDAGFVILFYVIHHPASRRRYKYPHYVNTFIAHCTAHFALSLVICIKRSATSHHTTLLSAICTFLTIFIISIFSKYHIKIVKLYEEVY